jgi:MFS family permease
MTGSQTADSLRAVVTEPPEQRRTLATLVFAQILSGVGLAAGVTVGVLLAQEMLGTARLSGLSTAMFAIGGAAAAEAVGRLSQRFGRRTGLTAGYLVGALGSLGVVAAAWLDSLVLLFASFLVYGAGAVTNLQARYAGADLAAPSRRGRAVSTVLVATTLGAVVGPNLVTVTGSLAEALDIQALAGPFLLAVVAYAASGLVLWVMLRPDPLQLARAMAAATADEDKEDPRTSGTTAAAAHDMTRSRPSWSRAALSGAGILIITQFVMVAIMTMTPIHIQDHGHHVAATGVVIGLHVAGMFLPSPITGWLVDRFGRLAVAVASGVTLLAAGLVAALAPPTSVATLAVALILLGLGWNFGLVSGSTLIADATPLESRARTQGTIDLGVAVAAAAAGLASGLIVSTTSYAALAIAGGLAALAVIPIAALARLGPKSAELARV